jgi:hypothetical protein
VTPTNFFGSGEASSLTVTVNSLVTPSVGISALPGTTNCPGTPVTFSAMAVDGGSAPSYQWQRSGIDVAEATNSTYVLSGWSDGEVITCKLIPSQEICTAAAFAISPGLIVGVSPPMLSIPGGTNKSVESTDAWTFDEPASVDACGTNTIMVLSTTTNRTCGAGYVATRVWQAVNPFSNSATCTQVVTVVDTTPPVILCPSNVTVECSSPWEFGTPLAADRGLGGVLVYDNSVNDLMTRLETGTNEVGNEIILAGTERYLQGFSYEFWSTNLTGDPWLEGGSVTVRLRFYANDGTNLNGYAVPGTLLFDSGEFGLGTGTSPRATVLYDEFDLWLFAPHPLMDALPPSFTWTVQFAGLGEHDRVGVDLYSPPVVGQSYGDFWVRTDDGWELREVPGLATDAAAQAFASTNRVTISVLGTVTNASSPGVFLATRTWRATDARGNYSDCSQTVTVVDTSPPVISRYPPNVVLAAGTNCLATLFDLTGELVATDSCSQVTVSQQPPPGTELGPGNYVITFVASDTASNSSTCALLLTVTSPLGANTSIHISEFMAKNTLTITDDDASYSDWIEIHNNGLCPISLEGWALTDDVTQLAKWRFPATNIAGGEFMIIWASDKNRRVPGAPLHTNFKLSEGGEYLALVQPDGVNIVSQFYPTFPPQLPDVSYGVPTDGLSNTYLAWPTPGLPDSPGTNFVVAGLSIRPGRGWYTNSV